MALIDFRWSLAFIIVLEIFLYSIFLQGFFPQKASFPGQSHVKIAFLGQHVVSQPTRKISRLVFVLIDALRSDFVSEGNKMPYVQKKIQQGFGKDYTLRAHPPTVTLPRIKALTSGTIPGFVDVVLNFDSKTLTEDNWVSQLYTSDRKIVFYGDDTWLKLFPDHFVRHDGTTSFFVTDFTEVDDNVTRHLDEELSSLDWNVMILHYLGLDHIGHTAGPTSPLVGPKLLEMDSVIQLIYENLAKKDKNFVVLVCGDHGMSDQGSHGGASDREVLVPSVFLSPTYTRDGEYRSSHRDLYQIDIAPTISVLMGLPIPSNNLGQILIGTLQGLTQREKLDAMYLNIQQILELMKAYVPDFEQERSYYLYKYAVELHEKLLNQTDSMSEEAALKVLRTYEAAIEDMSSKISGSLTTYDLYAMMCSIALLFLALLSVLLCSLAKSSNIKINFSPIFVGITLLVVFGHMTVCTSQSLHSGILCGRSLTSIFVQLVTLLSILSLLAVLMSSMKSAFSLQWMPKTPLQGLLVMGTVFHTLSFGASSFVEEEHQTWYFLTMTCCCVAMTTCVRDHVIRFVTKCELEIHKCCKENGNKHDYKYCDKIRHLNKINSCKSEANYIHGEQSMNLARTNNTPEQSCYKTGKKFTFSTYSVQQIFINLPWKQIFGTLGVMMLGRCLRAINQTGNKWLDVPDLGDWLIIPDNRAVLSAVVFVSHSAILIASGLKADLESCCFALGILSCYVYRVKTGSVSSILDLTCTSTRGTQGIAEARIVYSIILLLNLIPLIKWTSSKYKCQSKDLYHPQNPYIPHSAIRAAQLAWILLMTMLMRVHNTLLVAMVMVQERLLWTFVIRHASLSPAYLAVFCWWMGQAVFFQQGNSNSISTVDVSAGYVGLTDYQPVLVAMLLFCSTYAGPVFWLITLIKYMLQLHQDRHEQYRIENNEAALKIQPPSTSSFLQCIQAFTLERLFTLVFYTVLVTSQRYHLFVWTVFSPKLLYEGTLTVLYAVFSVVVLIFSSCTPVSSLNSKQTKDS